MYLHIFFPNLIVLFDVKMQNMFSFASIVKVCLSTSEIKNTQPFFLAKILNIYKIIWFIIT